MENSQTLNSIVDVEPTNTRDNFNTLADFTKHKAKLKQLSNTIALLLMAIASSTHSYKDYYYSFEKNAPVGNPKPTFPCQQQFNTYPAPDPSFAAEQCAH